MRLIVAAANGLRADANYFPEFLAGFSARASTAGYDYLDIRETDIDTHLNDVAGLALVLTGPAQFEILDSLADRGIPVVAANHYRGQRSIPCARVDDAGAVEAIVDHLVTLRHRRIAFLSGPEENLDARDRLEGFSRAVRKYALIEAVVQTCDFYEEAGHAGAKALLSAAVKPTALICCSDLAAVGAVQAAREVGISVPIDLSIAGFGDFPMVDYVYPSITTVRQPRYDLGRAAAEMLIDVVEGRVPVDTLLPAAVVLRQSTVACLNP